MDLPRLSLDAVEVHIMGINVNFAVKRSQKLNVFNNNDNRLKSPSPIKSMKEDERHF